MTDYKLHSINNFFKRYLIHSNNWFSQIWESHQNAVAIRNIIFYEEFQRNWFADMSCVYKELIES